MTKAQLSARQAEQEHVQGMLNVAFTRARDEVRVYHSAPLEQFATAGGEGALRDWLVHLRRSRAAPPLPPPGTPQDGSFGAEVREALRAAGSTAREYPAAGLSVDLVAEQRRPARGRRVRRARCGTRRHRRGREPPGDPGARGLARRAHPVPRLARRRAAERHLGRVDAALAPPPPAPVAPLPRRRAGRRRSARAAPRSRHAHYLTAEERAILVALGAGSTAPDDVLRGAREALGYARLGPRIRRALEAATASLASRGLVVVEDGEVFATEEARSLLAQQGEAGPTAGVVVARSALAPVARPNVGGASLGRPTRSTALGQELPLLRR